MQAAKQQSWQIKINARGRANKFHFKFKASKINSTWKFLKFSLFLRLHQFLLQVKSDSTPTQQKSTLKSKFLKFFRKFRAPRTKKQSIAEEKNSVLQYPESKVSADPLSRSTNEELFVGILALLSLFFKNSGIVKARTSMVFLIVTLVISATMLPWDKYIYHGTKDYAFQLVWKAWNYAASSLWFSR
ncbi:hypothetical protein JCGZ_00659 [Jatropha curcas]|uniref:Uncharacterized protein n=1 Tax=Jatropha curcas TaxID=180498 RepID=A0A067JDG6_JATCU|nr:uncharacterized protein LOC105649109 [Jatropha curcas]KDP21872.1 hypothetical protein JCGZ_00659 [Jatropha curcas]